MTVDVLKKEGSMAVAKMVARLFDLWRLSAQEQVELLGLESESELERYRSGKLVSHGGDIMDRAANLLSIHASLRILFPRNRGLVYRWPSTKNKAFGGLSPVEFIRKEGFAGLLAVKRYLEEEV